MVLDSLNSVSTVCSTLFSRKRKYSLKGGSQFLIPYPPLRQWLCITFTASDSNGQIFCFTANCTETNKTLQIQMF